MHKEYPNVVRLAIHLQDQQQVLFNPTRRNRVDDDTDPITSVLAQAQYSAYQLTLQHANLLLAIFHQSSLINELVLVSYTISKNYRQTWYLLVKVSHFFQLVNTLVGADDGLEVGKLVGANEGLEVV